MPPSLTRALCAALIACATGAPVGVRAQGTVLPGYWESTNQLNVLFSQKPTVTRKCLTAAQVQQWLNGPSNRHYSCVYTRRVVSGGHVSLGGVCTDRRGRTADVSVRGVYAPEHFRLEAAFHYRLAAGVAIPGTAVTAANRISADCPADLTPGK